MEAPTVDSPAADPATPPPGRGPAPQHRSLPPVQLALVAVLLAAPVVALMWVSSYNKATPELWGFPFFYWYQLLWVFLAAACTSIAYRVVVGHRRREDDERVGGVDRTDGVDGGAR